VVEESAEAFSPVILGVRVRMRRCPLEQLVVESLVVSLTMVVLDVLVNDQAQVTFTEHDESVEALLLDRAHKPVLSENRIVVKLPIRE